MMHPLRLEKKSFVISRKEKLYEALLISLSRRVEVGKTLTSRWLSGRRGLLSSWTESHFPFAAMST
jgi:hypothetical protein